MSCALTNALACVTGDADVDIEAARSELEKRRDLYDELRSKIDINAALVRLKVCSARTRTFLVCGPTRHVLESPAVHGVARPCERRLCWRRGVPCTAEQAVIALRCQVRCPISCWRNCWLCRFTHPCIPRTPPRYLSSYHSTAATWRCGPDYAAAGA
jgi:hypothetical protein